MEILRIRQDHTNNLKRARRRLLCLFACLHTCRLKDAVIRKVAFSPPMRRGYTVENNGTFYIYDNRGAPISVARALADKGLRCFHAFIPKNARKRIAVVVIHHRDDFEREGDLSSVKQPSRNFIVYSHGNSTDIGYMFGHYINLAIKQGANIMAYDYSGYGLSDGVVGEKQLYRNIEDVYTYLRDELHAQPEKIILYGNSIGSAPSSYLAGIPDKYPIGGLVLDAPLASAIRLQLGLIENTPRFDAFTNVEFLKHKDVYPTLIIHGTADTLIPIQHAMELAYVTESRHAERMSTGTGKYEDCFAAASHEGTCGNTEQPSDADGESDQTTLLKEPEDFLRTWWVPGANHNNIHVDHADEYHRTLQIFFQLCDKWRKTKNN